MSFFAEQSKAARRVDVLREIFMLTPIKKRKEKSYFVSTSNHSSKPAQRAKPKAIAVK
jgi:hypothetical protein